MASERDPVSASTRPPGQPDPVIQVQALSRRFESPAGSVLALDRVDFTQAAAELIAVVGESGSGKTTLLNLIAGLDRPSAGEILVGGVLVNAFDEDAAARWRRENAGIVFQSYQLLPTLSVLENVTLAMDLASVVPRSERQDRGLSLLDKVGVRDQAEKFPAALSGGQQQRVAIARALANDPLLVLADEPTGNLDSKTTRSVLELLRELADGGRTILLVTHESSVDGFADRVLTMSDGRLASDTNVSQGTRAGRL